MSKITPEGGALGPGAPVVAVDVGGTSIKVAAVSADGQIADALRVPTPARGDDAAERVLDVVADAVAQVATSETRAIGLTVPGIFDDERGFGHWSENLGWRDVDFAALTASRFDLPVALRHDVRAGALAERRLGSAREARNALVVIVGTGISAALFLDDKAHVAEGYAGEIGHAVVVPGGEKCLCGGRGCLEATASAAAIARRYRRRTGQEVSGAAHVLARAEQGDPDAVAVWESALDALALGLSHVVALIAPDVIVVGGGLSEAGDALMLPLDARLRTLVRVPPVPTLVRAHFGQDAGLVGAALAARDLVANHAAS